MNDWDRVKGCLVFPTGMRKATNQVCESSWRDDQKLGHPRQLHVQGEPGMGPGANATHSPLHARRGVRGGPRQMDLEARKSPGGYCMILGKSHQPTGLLPQGRRKGGSHVRH